MGLTAIALVVLTQAPQLVDPFGLGQGCPAGTTLVEKRTEGTPAWQTIEDLLDPKNARVARERPTLELHCVDATGKKDGPYARYGARSRLEVVGQISDGKQTGTWLESRFEDTVTQSEWMDGKLEGAARTWVNGRPKWVRRYAAGVALSPAVDLAPPQRDVGPIEHAPSSRDLWPSFQPEIYLTAMYSGGYAGGSVGGRAAVAFGPTPAKLAAWALFFGVGASGDWSKVRRPGCVNACTGRATAIGFFRTGLLAIDHSRFYVDLGVGPAFEMGKVANTTLPLVRAVFGVTSFGWSRDLVKDSGNKSGKRGAGEFLMLLFLAAFNHGELGVEWDPRAGPGVFIGFGFGI